MYVVAMFSRIALVLLPLLVLSAGEFATAQQKHRTQEFMKMKLESPAFEQRRPIPRRHTCEGDDISPALQWSGVPEETKSLALIMDDPDAPDPKAPKMTWVHWVLFNIPALVGGLPEAVERLPGGTREGLNDWKRVGYRGPCPPTGRHRYFHKLYALDTTLELQRPTKAELEKAMAGHVLAEAVLIGTYQKTAKAPD